MQSTPPVSSTWELFVNSKPTIKIEVEYQCRLQPALTPVLTCNVFGDRTALSWLRLLNAIDGTLIFAFTEWFFRLIDQGFDRATQFVPTSQGISEK
jgi:hypothetical protein